MKKAVKHRATRGQYTAMTCFPCQGKRNLIANLGASRKIRDFFKSAKSRYFCGSGNLLIQAFKLDSVSSAAMTKEGFSLTDCKPNKCLDLKTLGRISFDSRLLNQKSKYENVMKNIFPRILIALLLLSPIFIHGKAFGNAHEQSRPSLAIIPAGQESNISDIFTPPASLLPKGVSLDSIQISGHYLQLHLQRQNQKSTFQIHFGNSKREKCIPCGALEICMPDKKRQNWHVDYCKWLAENERNQKAIGIWKKLVKKPKATKPLTPKKEKNQGEKISYDWYQSLRHLMDISSPILAWFYFFLFGVVLLIDFYSTPRNSNIAAHWLKCLAILATLGLGLIFLFCSNSKTPTAFAFVVYPSFLLLSILPIFRLFRIEKKIFHWSALFDWIKQSKVVYIGVALLVFILFTLFPQWKQFVGDSIVFHIIFDLLFRFSIIVKLQFIVLAILFFWLLFHYFRSKEPGILSHFQSMRAFFHRLDFQKFFTAQWRQRSKILPMLGLLVPIFGGIYAGSFRYAANEPILSPALTWVDILPALTFFKGSILPQSHFLGHDFITSIFFSIFGYSQSAFAFIGLLYCIFACIALALVAKSVFRSWFAAIVMGILFPLWPQMQMLALDGMWFLLFLGFGGLCIVSMIEAARHPNKNLFWMAMLLAQFALEVRLEGIVLFCLLFVIEGFHSFPNRKHYKWLSLLFALNILRVMMITVDEKPFSSFLAYFAANAESYLATFQPASFILPLSFLLLSRNASKTPWIPLFWFLGNAYFYLLSPTVPGYKEAFVMLLPLLILPAGLFAFPKDERRLLTLSKVLLLMGIVVLLFSDFLMEKEKYSSERAYHVALGRQTKALIAKAPRKRPFLLEAAYSELISPRQNPIRPDGVMPNSDDLKRYIKANDGAYCFLPKTEKGVCCFLELQYEQVSKYGKESCWSYREMGFIKEDSWAEGSLQMVLLREKR